jgi:hypothetical protein
MRFTTKQHRFYCGIDLHARTLYVCIMDHEGIILTYWNLPLRQKPSPPLICVRALHCFSMLSVHMFSVLTCSSMTFAIFFPPIFEGSIGFA